MHVRLTAHRGLDKAARNPREEGAHDGGRSHRGDRSHRDRAGRRKGSFVDVRPEDLLASVVRHVVEQSGIEPSEIVDVIAGSVGQSQGNVARAAGLLAGLPETVPGTTVNRYCSSSLQARDATLGLETMCVAGGHGMAAIVERLN